MRTTVVLSVSVMLLLSLLVACAPQAAPSVPAPAAPSPAIAPAPAPAAKAPAKAGWEAKWEKALEEGKKERKIVVYSSAGGEVRVKTMEAFKNRYGIDIEWVAFSPAETAGKILAERRAGIYQVDHYLGGTTTPSITLRPHGVFDPLDSAFILPDITDPELIKKLWWKGSLGWHSDEHIVLAFIADPKNPITYNTEMVKAGEIKSYRDLLAPKFKDKITIRAPHLRGGGGKWFSMSIIAGMIDENYMRELAKQGPWVTADARLQVDWIARGKMLVGLGTDPTAVGEFIRLGTPVTQMIHKEGTYVSASHGAITLMNKSPHPNAAKVFVNWLLSQEGQTVFSRVMMGQSARLDVPTDHLLPSQIRQTGVEYFNSERQDVLANEEKYQKIAKEIFNIP